MTRSDPQNPERSGATPESFVDASDLKASLLTILKLAVIALAVFLIARVAANISWADFRREIADAHSRPLTAGFFFLLARWWIWQHRWSLALQEIGERTRTRRRFAALSASILVNHVTPTARVLGGVVRTRYLSGRWGGPFSRVYAAVLFDQLVHHSVIGLFTWLAFIGGAWVFGRPRLAVGAALALIVAATIIVRKARRDEPADAELGLGTPLLSGARKRVERLAPFIDHGRETLRIVRRLFRNRALLARSSAWSAGVFIASTLAQWCLFLALGTDIGPIKVAAIVGLGGFAGALMGTPGGIGSTEAAMIAGFVAVGVPRIDAVTAVLLFRGLHYVLVFGCGIPSLAALEWQRRARRRSEALENAAEQ
jgi:uncharacterized protein (TIRG00374 family)